MKFPVDLLADASLAELERSAHNYMNNLLYSNPDSPEHLSISASTKVTIDISSVGFVPLYGSDDTCKILALFSPSDPFVAVGLYLLDRWWAVEDILKTADPARDGVLEVETFGDRIVLYILNRVIYRGKEKTSDELPFLCHGEKDYAKIVWNNGEAVGFYSVKPSGTTCNSYSVRTYQLSVMDSIFVRKCQRRKGFGLQMLVDFVLSFKEESLGLRYPLTKSMYKVCEKYLCQYPGDADLLWEVESIGGPKQRTNIARKIMAIDISVSKNLSFTEESLLTPDVAETVLKETTDVECSVETMEEVTVLRATKEIDDVPVVIQRRSIHSKQRITEEKMTEDKSEKVIRIEEIEAETPRKERVFVQRETELLDSQELEQTEVLLSVFKEKAEDVVDTVPEGGPTMRSNKPAAVLTSGDLAEDHVTSATMTEEQHVEDDATQNLHNKSHDSQITVENVASETQETEVCEKEEEADIPFGGDAEENILPVELDEETSQKDEETPANEEQVQGVYGEGETLIERRVLRSGKKTVRATTRIKTTKRQDGEQEAEADGANTEGDAPAENGVVRKGRRSAATTRQQSKQAQEEREETTVTEEIQVDNTKAVLEETQEITETRDRKSEDKNEEEAEVQKNENPEPEVEIEEVEAVEGVSLREQDTVEEEQSTAEEEGKIMEIEIKPGNDAEQGEAESAPEEVEDSVLPKSATDSTVVSLNEEEAAPSAEEQQNEEMVCPISGLQGLTVVSVDMKKDVEVHEETAATEEAVPVEKIADEAEEEQREETMKEKITLPEEQIHDSSMEIEKTEIVKGIVEEEGLEEKVEDTVIMEDSGEGSAEEKGGENKSISDNEQNSTVNQTRTPRGRKKQVTAPTGHESVRVLRSGRKSVLVTPTRTRKSTQKQIQKDESEEGEESPSAEGTDPEEEAEQTPVIDQEKGETIENDASQHEETPAPEMDIENMNTVAEEAVTQDVPEVGQADSTETITDEDAEASVGKADEGMTSDVVEKEAVTGAETAEAGESTSEVEETAAGEDSENKVLTSVGKADEGMTSDVVEKEAVTGPETVEAGESTSEVEETAAGEDSENNLLTSNDDHEEETPVTDGRVLRSGKKTVRATTRIKTTQRQDGEQEAEADGANTEGDAPAEDKQEVASIQECAEETPDEGKVPSDEDAVTDETTIVDQTAEEAEEESSTAKEMHIAETKDNITEEIEENDGEDDASEKDDTEDTLNTNVDKASDEMETPAVESRVLRSGGKLVPTTPVSVETRILRKGRRSAPATTRRKSKRARIQHQPEEESDEETAPAEELEGEEGEVGQESPEKNEEKAEEEGKIMEMEVKPGNDAEQGEAESAPGGEYVVADTEQMKDSVIEETAVLEGDNSKTDVVETDIIQSSSAEIEETNSTEEEGITNIEKSTPVTEVVSDTAIAEEEALDEGAHEVAEEDAPAATTMSLRSKTKTSRTTRRSRGQKTQEPVQTKPQQMEEENVDDVETQEEPPMTDSSPEQREQKEEQTEAEETSATGQEADEDVAERIERIDKETSDSRVGESLGDDTQPTDKEEEEKVESDEDKDNMADDVSDNQHIKKLEEGNEEENLENAVEAGEKGSILNSTLDTDEEVETPGVSQIQENDEQNMSEEEMESILIEKRVLRSRTVPSVVITPQSKSRRHSAKVEIAEESSSDEEKSPQSSKRRSLRKRKSTDVTPAHKLRRSSRVQEAQQ